MGSKGQGSGAFPCSDSGRSGCSLPRTGAAPTPCLGVRTCGTWVSNAASSQREISHKVSIATTGYLQAVKTVFSRKQYPRELRIRAMQALVESGLLSNSGGSADVTLSQLTKLELVRSRVLSKIQERYRGEETSTSDEKDQIGGQGPAWTCAGHGKETPAGCTCLQRGHHLLCLHFYSGTDRHGSDRFWWISAVSVTP